MKERIKELFGFGSQQDKFTKDVLQTYWATMLVFGVFFVLLFTAGIILNSII